MSALLDRLLLKVALTKDETLPVALASFLIPAIEKLVSPDASVKAKVFPTPKHKTRIFVKLLIFLVLLQVIELLSHVTKRAKDQKFITFPVVALLNKYQQSAGAPFKLFSSSLIRSFADTALQRRRWSFATFS